MLESGNDKRAGSNFQPNKTPTVQVMCKRLANEATVNFMMIKLCCPDSLSCCRLLTTVLLETIQTFQPLNVGKYKQDTRKEIPEKLLKMSHDNHNLFLDKFHDQAFLLTLQLITTTFIKTVPITLNANVLNAYINYMSYHNQD